MTITYEGRFLKALFRWNGSVWKAIWKEMFVWLILYYVLRTFMIYYPFSNNAKEKLKIIAEEFYEYTKNVPLEFLLGFYVTQTVSRWWNQVKSWQDQNYVISILHNIAMFA